MRNRIACIGFIALLVVAAAQAQQPLTLADAQTEARAHAPETQELQAVIQGAQAVAAQANRRFRQDPTLSGGYFNGALIGQDETTASVDVSLPVDVSGSRKPRAASAEADVQRATFDRDNGLLALDEQVATAFADVALLQRRNARETQIENLYAVAADAVHQQLGVGQAAQLDADSADLDLAAARISLAQIRGQLAQARGRLARLLGRSAGNAIVASDAPENAALPARPDFDALIDRDPRVRAARAEIDAATFERQTYERLVTPTPTFGVSAAYNRRDIPPGSFTGVPAAGSLAATWHEPELMFNVSVPLPLFDKQLEPRAHATARLLTADARAQTVRADVRAELEGAWTSFEAAAGALQAVADTPAMIDRDVMFVEQAVRAGQFDALTRSIELRRLQDAGIRADTAVRDYRVARAAWLRRSMTVAQP